MEIKIIFPGKNHNDTDLTLDGRQEKDIEIYCNHLPGDSTIKDSTERRILLAEKWRIQMERLGISLLLSSMRFCSYSSVISCLSHCMSKELFFVLSISMIINLQVHIPLWKKKICILLVFIDVDHIPSFEIHVQQDIHIPISLELDYSSYLVENKADLLPSTIICWNFQTAGWTSFSSHRFLV